MHLVCAERVAFNRRFSLLLRGKRHIGGRSGPCSRDVEAVLGTEAGTLRCIALSYLKQDFAYDYGNSVFFEPERVFRLLVWRAYLAPSRVKRSRVPV
ncbi:hypothetical protein SANTM175S_01907 [Streptomyces antimycoticus]